MTFWLIFALVWLALACLIGGVHEAIRKVRDADRELDKPFIDISHCHIIPRQERQQ